MKRLNDLRYVKVLSSIPDTVSPRGVKNGICLWGVLIWALSNRLDQRSAHYAQGFLFL